LSDDKIKAIQEHIWNKYVEGAHDEFDENEALRELESFHRAHGAAAAPDTYYLGILYFEMAFERETEDERNLFLARAATILGLVGGGGLGQALYNDVQLADSGKVSTLIAAVSLLVIGSDWLSQPSARLEVQT